MSYSRIQFRDIDGTNTYTLPYNPGSVNLLDNREGRVSPTISGSPVLQRSTFDGRERTISWPAYQYSTSDFNTSIRVLKGFIGKRKQINLQTLNIPDWSWPDIRVTNVTKRIVNNSGNLRYSVVLSFVFDNTSPVTPVTLDELRDSMINISGCFNCQIADYIPVDGDQNGGGPEPNRLDQWTDKSANGNDLVQLGSNTQPAYHSNELGGRAIVRWSAPPDNDRLGIDSSVNANYATDYNPFCQDSAGGCGYLMLVKFASPGGSYTLMYFLSSFSNGITGAAGNDGISIRFEISGGQIRAFHGRGGTGAADWYVNNTNNIGLSGITTGTWYAFVFRTNYNNIWQFQDGLGTRHQRTSFDLTPDTSGDLDGTQFAPGGVALSSPSCKLTGDVALTASWSGYPSDTDLQNVFAKINSYYNQSFSLVT